MRPEVIARQVHLADPIIPAIHQVRLVEAIQVQADISRRYIWSVQ